MTKQHQHKAGVDCSYDCDCGCKNNKHKRPLAVIGRILCGLVFVAAAVLVLLNIFGVVTLSINIGILIAITALAIVAIYSAFHLFWGGLFFLAATIIVIMNANDLFFSLGGAQIGNLFIAAALLTVAFHVLFFAVKKKFGPANRTDATFGAAVKYFDDVFETANLECNFGSVKAYFENANLKGGKGLVNIECNFGGIELYVPKTWRVVDNTHAAFGASEEKGRAQTTAKSPVLTLKGEVNFGGLSIIYV